MYLQKLLRDLFELLMKSRRGPTVAIRSIADRKMQRRRIMYPRELWTEPVSNQKVSWLEIDN
jgi:hypothetical protein